MSSLHSSIFNLPSNRAHTSHLPIEYPTSLARQPLLFSYAAASQAIMPPIGASSLHPIRTPGCSTCTPIYPVYTHRSQPKMAPPLPTQPRHDDIPACGGSSCVVPTSLFASLCQAGRQNSLPRILLASCLENKSFLSPSHSAQLLLLNLISYWNQFWMAGIVESKSN